MNEMCDVDQGEETEIWGDNDSSKEIRQYSKYFFSNKFNIILLLNFFFFARNGIKTSIYHGH